MTTQWSPKCFFLFKTTLMPGRGWDVHRVPRVDSFDCRLLLEIKVVLGDFGFFLVVDRNRRLSRFFLGHFILRFHLQDSS